jgi:hypothetical protein
MLAMLAREGMSQRTESGMTKGSSMGGNVTGMLATERKETSQ